MTAYRPYSTQEYNYNGGQPAQLAGLPDAEDYAEAAGSWPRTARPPDRPRRDITDKYYSQMDASKMDQASRLAMDGCGIRLHPPLPQLLSP
ncbi:MAG: hypothetical protein ACLUEK_13725 [Oscillospiraceae bacterium]